MNAVGKRNTFGCCLRVVNALSVVASLVVKVVKCRDGSDIAYCPVFYAYMLVELDSATLFIDPGRLTADILADLAKADILIPWGATKH